MLRVTANHPFPKEQGICLLYRSGLTPRKIRLEKLLEKRHVPLRKTVWESAVRLVSAPRDPSIIGGSVSQPAAVKEAHRAAYYYKKAATIDLNRSPEPVKTWFEKLSQKVVNVLELMKQSLENDQITYSFEGYDCHYGTLAYTYKCSRNIYLSL